MISVVIPCYNYGRYLQDCINSLTGGPTCLGDMPGQTLRGFEAIIIDDASTDEQTGEIGHALADDGKGIRYVRLPHNIGTPRALNAGIARAIGSHIMVLSADDMLEPWALEKLYHTCLENPHGVAYGHLRIFRNGLRAEMIRLPDYNFDTLLRQVVMSAGIMYPKRAWWDAGGYPVEMVHGREDWAFDIALGIHGWCGVHVGESGYLYRREGQNRSIRTATSDMLRLFQQQFRSLYPKIYAGERPMACCGQGNPTKPQKKIMGGGNPGSNPSGMVQVEYIGGNAGNMTWPGIVSRRKYVLGGVTRFGWVDRRDLSTGRSSMPGLLELVDGRNKVFRLVPVKEPEPVVVEEKSPARIRGRRKSIIPEQKSPSLRDVEGIGPATERKLMEAGLVTPASLVYVGEDELAEIVGQRHAKRIWEAASALVD